MNGNTIVSIERIRKSWRTGRCHGRPACGWASVLLAMLPLLLPTWSFAGIINVTSSADVDVRDNAITLREALMFARGERDPHRDDGAPGDEYRRITGSVGQGKPDEIKVPASIGTIILTGALPALDDLTDSIHAASEVILDGSATGAPAFVLSTDDHTIKGFTARGFGKEDPDGDGDGISRAAIEITGSHNAIQAMTIEDSVAEGIWITGGDAKDNKVSDSRVDGSGDFGIVISGGATGNTLEEVFVYNGKSAGVVIRGEGTNGNTLIKCGIGMTYDPDLVLREPAGNAGFGIEITGKAKNNRLGDPNDFARFTYVSFNDLGGIKISDQGTEENILHSLWLGHHEPNPGGSGNGSGPGITVSDKAKNNQIGQPGIDASGVPLPKNPRIYISGHDDSGIVITGEGTDGNDIKNVFIGGPNPLVPGAEMKNKGHGIVVEKGAGSMVIGGERDYTQVEINYTGGGEGDTNPRHAILVDGSDKPIKMVTISTIHLGNERVEEGDPVFTGDGIHITGDVDGVRIGRVGHDNDVHGAAGYGIRIDGPDVKNVTMFQVHVGNQFGMERPNNLGGIMIRNGAEVTIGDNVEGHRCFIASNGGPGITIDASGTAPATLNKILIQNAYIGLDEYALAAPNEGPGILVKGKTDGAAVARTNVQIGTYKDDSGNKVTGLGNIISANTGNGIELSNVSGVEIFANKIGTHTDGKVGTGNEQNGILVDGGSGAKIGAIHSPDLGAGNIISGNKKNGVLIDNKAEGVNVLSNKIGTGPKPDTHADPNRNAIENPNEEHGISIQGGATLTVVQENSIRFNKEHGIRVHGDKTKQNKFTMNSIHRNGKEGIRLLEGANGGIKPPIVNRIVTQAEVAAPSFLRITDAIPNRKFEVFADRIPLNVEDGYYGQGKEFLTAPIADAQGKYSYGLALADPGIITATVTDAQKNTSAFSPFMQGIVIQTVQTEADLLVANKPTVVRVFADTGKGMDRWTVTASLRIVDGDTFGPSQFYMRPVFGYFDRGRLADRREARNSLNFHLNKPWAGKKSFEVTMKDGDKERGKLDMGEFEFQTTGSFAIGIVPVWAPNQWDVAGGSSLPLEKPDLTQVHEVLHYFAAVFPFEPTAFLRNSRILKEVVFPYQPHFGLTRSGRDEVDNLLLKVRDRINLAEAAGRGRFEYGVGLVSRQSRFNPTGSPRTFVGFTISATDPGIVAILDFAPAPAAINHAGGTLLHEIGHTDPFNLGDTYVNADATPRLVNPVLLARNSGFGNRILEEHQAFCPQQAIIEVFGLTGPVFSGSGAGEEIHDFMGNRDPAWADETTYEILYREQLRAAGGPIAALKRDTSNAMVHISPAMLVQGTLSTDDTINIIRIDRTSNQVDRLELRTDVGDLFTVELQDAAGNALDSQVFAGVFDLHVHSIDETTGESTRGPLPLDVVPFNVVLEDDPDAARVVVRKGTTVLATVEPSASPPRVTLVGPNGPGDLSGDVEVTWTASDPDPDDTDNLIIDVLYTPDDGGTIHPVATGQQSTGSVTIGTDDLPGGDTARFIVRASDGWNSAEAQSEPAFQVSDRAPTIAISLHDAELSDDVPQGLFAAAYDAEDGFLLEDSIQWLLDGVAIASGSTPNVMLPAGAHTLKATATDSAGQEVSAEVNINVAQFQDVDSDGDGVLDSIDNCLDVANADQADADLDGIGDACDPVTSPINDMDGDDVVDDQDNCPHHSNADQADEDGDGIGDVCEPDSDADDVLDDDDNCPQRANPNQTDDDGDGIGNVCEEIPLPDGDDVGEQDTDGDGVVDASDNCPQTANADQADADGDGVGDACEDTPGGDADGDGVLNEVDNCPQTANVDQADSDGDGVGDACEDTPGGDADGDGVLNEVDNCPQTANADQADEDGDGIGDVCTEEPCVPDNRACGACGQGTNCAMILSLFGWMGLRSQSRRRTRIL